MPDTLTLKSFPVAIQKAAKDRTFSFIISSDAIDRDRDVIDPTGWRLDNYRKNPVVLWQHRRDLPPIARAISPRVSGSRLLSDVEFPPQGISPLADEIHDLLAAGFLTSASVGFTPIRSIYNSERDGLDILEAELLEFSIVNIPANAEARVLRCVGEACDLPAMKSWLSGSVKASCACGGGDVLELADDRFLEISEPATYLELSEPFVFTDDLPAVNRALGDVIRRELANVIAESIRDTLDYQMGRVR